MSGGGGFRATLHHGEGRRADADLARLHRLGHLAHKVDHQQAILKVGRLYPDELGQFEAALEAAIGDADVEELRALSPPCALCAFSSRSNRRSKPTVLRR